MNIDAQDAQDNQDGRLLQETLTRAMIACGFEDVREHKPAVSGKNPVHPVHPCESKIYPCLTMNRFPATRRKRLFQTSRAPAPHDGADHSRVKPVGMTSGAQMLRAKFCALGADPPESNSSERPASPRPTIGRGGNKQQPKGQCGFWDNPGGVVRDLGIPSRLTSTP